MHQNKTDNLKYLIIVPLQYESFNTNPCLSFIIKEKKSEKSLCRIQVQVEVMLIARIYPKHRFTILVFRCSNCNETGVFLLNSGMSRFVPHPIAPIWLVPLPLTHRDLPSRWYMLINSTEELVAVDEIGPNCCVLCQRLKMAVLHTFVSGTRC
jgi:hypothetical protein